MEGTDEQPSDESRWETAYVSNSGKADDERRFKFDDKEEHR